MCNAYNEGAEKGELNMNENNKKIILNKINYIIGETIMMMLLIVAILIFVAEDQIATAILVGVGLIANIGMILTSIRDVKIYLDIIIYGQKIYEQKINRTRK